MPWMDENGYLYSRYPFRHYCITTFVYLAFDVLAKLRYINMRHCTKVHKIFKCTIAIGLKHTECVVICTHDKEVTRKPLTAVALTYAR